MRNETPMALQAALAKLRDAPFILDAIRAAEALTEANTTGERMSIPGSTLGIVFMALLIAPALLRMFTHT